MRIRLQIILAFLLLSTSVFSEVAVIPYRIENPSQFFPVSLGADYAKLLSVAAIIRKGAEIYSPRELDADLRGKTINPQRTVTEEDLYLLGKGRYLDRILIGTLYRAGGIYTSESLVYSVRDRKVLFTSRVRASDLFELAEKEVKAVFAGRPDRVRRYRQSAVDAAVVCDLSSNSWTEWDYMKKGIMNFAEAISDHWSADLRVHIIPYSERTAMKRELMGLRTASAIKNSLDALIPAGGNTSETIEAALTNAVKNVAWRREAKRMVLFINNSPITRSRFLENIAYQARRDGLRVHTIGLGRMNGEGRVYLREVSTITRGLGLSAAYHQRLFNAEGRGIDLFMQDGRLFQGVTSEARWSEGLYQRAEGPNARPRPFLKEVFFSSAKQKRISPYTLKDSYVSVTGETIINSGPLETNVGTLLASIVESSRVVPGEGEAPAMAGRVLLTDGRTSLWTGVGGDKEMDFFRKAVRSKRLVPVGVVVQRNQDEAFGFSFNPNYLITGVETDFIPDLLKASLEDILKDPDRFAGRGLFSPPIWFIEVNVEKTKSLRSGKDIRE